MPCVTARLNKKGCGGVAKAVWCTAMACNRSVRTDVLDWCSCACPCCRGISGSSCQQAVSPSCSGRKLRMPTTSACQSGCPEPACLTKGGSVLMLLLVKAWPNNALRSIGRSYQMPAGVLLQVCLLQTNAPSKMRCRGCLDLIMRCTDSTCVITDVLVCGCCRAEVDSMIERRVRDFRLDTRLKTACEHTITDMCSYLGDMPTHDSYDAAGQTAYR